jgi:hypothetical protein
MVALSPAIATPKRQQTGAATPDLSRQDGTSSTTFFKQRSAGLFRRTRLAAGRGVQLASSTAMPGGGPAFRRGRGKGGRAERDFIFIEFNGFVPQRRSAH